MPKLIDIHCHFMPYVDDGAHDMEEAVEALQLYKDQGIGAIVLTPHYRRGMFETAQTIMERQFLTLKAEADAIGIKLFTGCEYHTDDKMVDELTAGNRWTLADSRYVLTEFSARNTMLEIRERVKELRANGFRPIIAHIERYPAVRDTSDPVAVVDDLIELGAYIQVNADAVMGLDGKVLQNMTRLLIEQGMVHFIASDAHGVDYRPSNLKSCYEYVRRKYGADEAARLFIDNPLRVIRSGAANRKSK